MFWFGNLPSYFTQKNILCYRVIIHIRSMVDFDSCDLSPLSSLPDSDDGDSGYNGNPDWCHFSRGSGQRVQGFKSVRGAIDGDAGEQGGSNTSSAHFRRRDVTTQIRTTAAPISSEKEKQKWVLKASVRPKLDQPIEHVQGKVTAAPVITNPWGPLHFEFDSMKHPGIGIGVQPASDPMVLEAR